MCHFGAFHRVEHNFIKFVCGQNKWVTDCFGLLSNSVRSLYIACRLSAVLCIGGRGGLGQRYVTVIKFFKI